MNEAQEYLDEKYGKACRKLYYYFFVSYVIFIFVTLTVFLYNVRWTPFVPALYMYSFNIFMEKWNKIQTRYYKDNYLYF